MTVNMIVSSSGAIGVGSWLHRVAAVLLSRCHRFPRGPLRGSAKRGGLELLFAIGVLTRHGAQLAERHSTSTASAPAGDGWLDAKRAADYLGLSIHALHKLTAERAVPFEQEGQGCKLWFRRAELDAWRETGGARSLESAGSERGR
jgi:hypothetical protein